MSKAKRAVMRPQFRSRQERDRKKEERKDPEETDWVFYDDPPIDKTDWPDLDLENDKRGE